MAWVDETSCTLLSKDHGGRYSDIKSILESFFLRARWRLLTVFCFKLYKIEQWTNVLSYLTLRSASLHRGPERLQNLGASGSAFEHGRTPTLWLSRLRQTFQPTFMFSVFK